MTFSQIAHVYDDFNDLSVYEHWLDFTLNMLSAKPEKVLDLACGTGWFTQLLEPFVGQLIGLDIDSRMIERAREESPTINFVLGDMTDFAQEHHDFDLITCYLDSLCFLADFKAVQACFNEVYTALNEDAVFLFDVWTPMQITQHFDGFQYTDYNDEAALIWQSFSNPEKLSVTHELTVFEKETTNLYKRTDVDLHERTYPIEQYLEGLRLAGFKQENMHVYVDFGAEYYEESYHKAADRWFISCSKE